MKVPSRGLNVEWGGEATDSPRHLRRGMPVRGLLLIALFILISAEIGGNVPASPIGSRLPSVSGNSLEGSKIRFPEDLAGRPAVLLVAYRRGTQPDIDRWMDFLTTNHPGVTFYEVPTITGVVWKAVSGWIDGGMRGGVPKENWPRVVTLYEDASILKGFLGDHGGYHTHVIVLDGAGTVAWFHAAGYSDGAAAALDGTLKGIVSQ